MEEKNNGFIYFILGALFIAIIGLGYLYASNDNAVSNVEPAAGEEQADFNVEITDDGFKASAEDDQ